MRICVGGRDGVFPLLAHDVFSSTVRINFGEMLFTFQN